MGAVENGWPWAKEPPAHMEGRNQLHTQGRSLLNPIISNIFKAGQSRSDINFRFLFYLNDAPINILQSYLSLKHVFVTGISYSAEIILCSCENKVQSQSMAIPLFFLFSFSKTTLLKNYLENVGFEKSESIIFHKPLSYPLWGNGVHAKLLEISSFFFLFSC